MKLWLPIVVFVSCLLAGCASKEECSCTAPTPPAHTAVSSTISPGTYAGTWTSSDGGGGAFHVSLKKPSADAPWDSVLSFTYDGNDAVTTMKSVEVNGTNISLAYDYQLGDGKGTVEMTGALRGDSLEGSYKVLTGDGGAGTWKASRVP